jgi:hypothetical protein
LESGPREHYSHELASFILDVCKKSTASRVVEFGIDQVQQEAIFKSWRNFGASPDTEVLASAIHNFLTKNPDWAMSRDIIEEAILSEAGTHVDALCAYFDRLVLRVKQLPLLRARPESVSEEQVNNLLQKMDSTVSPALENFKIDSEKFKNMPAESDRMTAYTLLIRDANRIHTQIQNAEAEIKKALGIDIDTLRNKLTRPQA